MNNKIVIKFIDGDGDYIGTITPKKLKNKVFFTENINGGQGELILTFSEAFSTYFNEAFFCEVYTIDDENPLGLKIYNGIVNQRVAHKSNIDELSLHFVGLGTALYNRFYYDYGSSLDYDFTVNEDPSTTIGKIIAQVNTLVMTFSSISGGPFQVGESVTGGTSGAVGKIEYFTGTTYYISFISGRFQKNESVSGSVSFATAQITWTLDNIYWGKITSGTVSSYGTSMNTNIDYLIDGILMEDIMRFSDGFYYYIDKDGELNYKANPTTSTHVMAFGGEQGIIDIQDLEHFDIYNRIYVEWSGGVQQTQDTTSINDFGLREYYYSDTNIQDSATALEVANNLLATKKDPLGEIRIRISKHYKYIVEAKKWKDLTDTWADYTDPWEDFGLRRNIHDIEPGQLIDVRNIDNDLKYSGLQVVRKEYEEDYVTLYCSSYFNFNQLIK